MKKKFLAFCVLMPICLTGCGKKESSNYLDRKTAVSLLTSIKQYRADHESDFKLFDHVVADTSFSIEFAMFSPSESDDATPLGGTSHIVIDQTRNIYQNTSYVCLDLGDLLYAEEHSINTYFVDGSTNVGNFARYEESDNISKKYWTYDLSDESDKKQYDAKIKSDFVETLCDNIFSPTQIADYIGYINGDFATLSLYDNYNLNFVSQRITSSGQGSIDIVITGYTRRAMVEEGSLEESFSAGDSLVNAHVHIEDYQTTLFDITVLTTVLTEEENDSGKTEVVTGTIKIHEYFNYRDEIEEINLPDLNEYEKVW